MLEHLEREAQIGLDAKARFIALSGRRSGSLHQTSLLQRQSISSLLSNQGRVLERENYRWVDRPRATRRYVARCERKIVSCGPETEDMALIARAALTAIGSSTSWTPACRSGFFRWAPARALGRASFAHATGVFCAMGESA
jgi:hypothetical protein